MKQEASFLNKCPKCGAKLIKRRRKCKVFSNKLMGYVLTCPKCPYHKEVEVKDE